MKKLIVLLILISCLTGHGFTQTCPDCNTVSFTAVNATGYGCNGELFVTFNGNCPTQVQVTGTQYDGTPYNNINPVVTPPTGHWNLKAGSYSFQLTSYDGLTLQCSTAFIPFTITQPVCDYDLHYQLGTPDYCIGTVPVSIWSTNQGCTNTQNAIQNEMVINGITAYNNQPVTFDMFLETTDSFTVYNYDFTGGSLQSVCSENITITTPGCSFGITVKGTIGTTCSNHKITVTAIGGLCGGQWGADLYLNSVYDTTIYSGTNQIQFTNLTNGSYDVFASSAACSDAKSIALNYCPKPNNTQITNLTSTSVKTKWTPQSCGLGYQVLYRVQGTTPWITKTVTSNTGNKVISGLTPSTTYEWKARTKCQNAPAVFSAYSNIKTFTTLAAREGDFLSTYDNGNNAISDLTLAPNPAMNELYVTFNSEDLHADLQIINITGQLMSNRTVSINENNSAYVLNVASLPQGIYLVKVRTENGIATRRFIKQ